MGNSLRLVCRRSVGGHTQDHCLWGIGRRQKLNCSAITVEMSAHPMVSSGAGMALHSCPGFEARASLPFVGQDSDATLNGAVMKSQQPILLKAEGRALILKRSPDWRIRGVSCRIFCSYRLRFQPGGTGETMLSKSKCAYPVLLRR